MPRTDDPGRPAIFRHSGLLGTLIEIRVFGNAGDAATERVDQIAIAEIERLEQVFSAFDERSTFARWRRGAAAAPRELAELLAMALDWHNRSNGGFNPMVGELTERWKRAESDGHVPTNQELLEIAERIREPRWTIVNGVPEPIGDCLLMNLHAIAKGYIVDRALDRAVSALGGDAESWISINAGGDLAHRGAGVLRVGIENPHRPYDNEPPLVSLVLSNAALATSGLARRGFRVGGRWYGHVLDPRSGWPVEAIASISVVGPDAATADVVATAAGVLPPGQAVAFVDELDGVEALIVDADRHHIESDGWSALVIA